MKFLFFCLTAVLLQLALSDSGVLVVLKHCSNSFNKEYVDKVLTPRKPINRTTSLTSMDIYIKSGVVLDSPLYVSKNSFEIFYFDDCGVSCEGEGDNANAQVKMKFSKPVHVEFFKKFATQYKTFMINYKAELCEGLQLKNHPLYPYLFNKSNETETNIYNTCPLKGHIFIKPYYTHYDYLPPLVPTGIWRTVVTVTKGLNDKLLTIINHYEVTPIGIEEF